MVDQVDSESSTQRQPEERINHTKTGKTELADPNNESVASLLSQLEFPVMSPSAGPSNSVRAFAGRDRVNQTRPVELEENRRNISFRAALPILSELAEHEPFLSGLKKVGSSSSVGRSNDFCR